MKREQKAVLEMLLCASLWSIAGIFIKQLPWHGLAVAAIRSLIAGLTFAVYMAVQHMRFRFDRRTLTAGVLAGSVYLCFATANKLTTAANAIVLQFTDPAFLVLYTAILYKKRPRGADLAVVLAVMGGITLFFFDQLGPSTALGNLVAVASGMFMAGMYLAVQQLETEERFSAILIGQLFAFLTGLPAVIVTRPVLNPTTLGCVLVLGVFQLGLAYILYVKASAYCPPLACALLGAVEPLLNPVWVMIFDGETPGVYALIGGVIVIAAVTAWGVWDSRQKAAASGA
ncbi:MAG: EamA family transporter, partial [Oscillospiraceae bacterium]|nr:EamA family transporter [Oscillospiraceae bacterium]